MRPSEHSVLIDVATLIQRNPRVAYHELSQTQGGVLLHLDTGAYHGVNEVGFLVWELIEQQMSFAALLDGLRERLVEPPRTLAEEIAVFIRALSERDLVTLSRSEGGPSQL
jgi:hypothetical protein